ncbi:hypothetical protein [Desulfobacter curvatus]|uniref:hypothetical protein n=1 Tax=Desulfobacter curvatus TaxID=2290 RepID=UPI0003814D0D|nr:hypothetical protein [Desulfobacter curvatus]
MELGTAKNQFLILPQNLYKEWDRFVDISPQGSVFAKTHYLDAIGFPYQIGVLVKKGNIAGGIILVKSEIKTYSNPLFAKYLGILLRPVEGKYANKITIEKKIIEQIVSNIKWCKTFDYTFHYDFQNWMPFYWAGYRQESKYTYLISNLKNMDSLYDKMQSNARKNMRKAVKNNISIIYDICPENFYRINEMTFLRQGGPIPYSLSFFKRFYAALKKKDSIKLLGAFDRQQRCHSVCGLVYDNKACHLLLNGSNPDLPNMEANTLLVGKAIEYASQVSEVFDFEGSMIKSIERFYRGFGGVMTPYHNIWKDNFFNFCKKNALKKYKKIRYGKTF